MAEKKTRAAARKIKDKWKSKVWYNLLAPEMFNRQLIGETLSDEPTKIVGRIAEVTVQDLTGDFSKMHIKLQFRVNQVQGQDAVTQFVGHDMTSDYIRRLTRRKRTRTDVTVDVATKERAIRAIIGNGVRDAASKLSMGEFMKAVISGELAKAVAVACKPIQPISRVEIRKSEVHEIGQAPAAPAPAAPPEGEPAPEELTPEDLEDL